jgi:hypothetical protein
MYDVESGNHTMNIKETVTGILICMVVTLGIVIVMCAAIGYTVSGAYYAGGDQSHTHTSDINGFEITSIIIAVFISIIIFICALIFLIQQF